MKQHKLFYGSSYDRGLDILLFIWEDIKKEFPDAELHICYGWDLFDKATVNNPERRQWKERVDQLMLQDGIIHHGRVGKQKLEKIRKECGIWAYPTYFTEINCITALECQRDGCVPVTMTLAALDETVQSGVKVDGNIREPEVMEKYKKELIKMMKDKEKWQREVEVGKKHTENYKWEDIAKKWDVYFKKEVEMPLVSIITPTIREGFWSIMSENINDQTYPFINIEWIIVDDHKKDRSYLAEKYNARYFRGKQNNNRKYGLSSANNIGWKNAKGEICVWLQDFVLMPHNGIEMIVDLWRHNKNSLIAPVDVYHKPVESGKELIGNDNMVFSGYHTDFIGDFLWKNSRNKRLGIRKTTNPTDFEMNYGAIPKKVLEELNGFWEFYDEALGFDNTEIAERAMRLGSEIIIDDSNVAVCIDHWEPLKDKQDQLGEGRTHALNDPRYVFMMNKMRDGKLPLKRSQEIDDMLDLKYDIPKELNQDEAVAWMRKNIKKIVKSWDHLL